MILCDREIQVALREGQILLKHGNAEGSDLTPEEIADLLSSTSLDLTLYQRIRRWEVKQNPGTDPTIFCPGAPGSSFEATARANTILVDLTGDGFVLKPGEFALGWTSEWVQLPYQSRIAERVEGKSSFARHGVGVHVTAPTIHAGFEGQIQLEIFNVGPLDVRLIPGVKVCQLILEQVYGTPEKGYRGQFSGQSG